MKAAKFYKKHQLVLSDIPVPEPSENEILIKVHYCGICGTDIHIFEGDKASANVLPMTTIGHEFSGEIVKTGTNVADFLPGQRVAVDPNSYCGHCYFCSSGNDHFCDKMTGLGTARDGGFAEYACVPSKLVYKLPDSLDSKAAAMIEPVSCCVHGIELTDIQLGDNVLIIGTGSIGLIMVQLARHLGASNIIASEPSAFRRGLARKYGANITIDPSTDNLDLIMKEHNIPNIERVIDCAGKISTAEYAIRYAGKGSTVMLFGLTKPDETLSIKPFELFQKELTIKGSFVNPKSFEKAIHLLKAGVVKTEDIITDIYPLEQIQDVFEKKLYAKSGKVLIQCT